jgi:rhodanese-related sulfurtransferase
MMERIVDVREFPEFAAGHIEGSVLVPLRGIERAAEGWGREEQITLVCRSGRRADEAREQLERCGFSSVMVLPGGIEAWVAAGQPVKRVEGRRVWSLERQVRAGAGSLVLITLLLAYVVSRRWLIGTAMVGGGLVFAGVSDICMMASVLGRMPWNRARRDEECQYQ